MSDFHRITDSRLVSRSATRPETFAFASNLRFRRSDRLSFVTIFCCLLLISNISSYALKPNLLIVYSFLTWAFWKSRNLTCIWHLSYVKRRMFFDDTLTKCHFTLLYNITFFHLTFKLTFWQVPSILVFAQYFLSSRTEWFRFSFTLESLWLNIKECIADRMNAFWMDFVDTDKQSLCNWLFWRFCFSLNCTSLLIMLLYINYQSRALKLLKKVTNKIKLFLTTGRTKANSFYGLD